MNEKQIADEPEFLDALKCKLAAAIKEYSSYPPLLKVHLLASDLARLYQIFENLVDQTIINTANTRSSLRTIRSYQESIAAFARSISSVDSRWRDLHVQHGLLKDRIHNEFATIQLAERRFEKRIKALESKKPVPRKRPKRK